MTTNQMVETVYIVMAESGEYSDRYEWVAGVFTDAAEAQRLLAEHERQARIDEAAYRAWMNGRDRFIERATGKSPWWMALRDPSYPSADEIDAVIGPCPNEAEADRFYIVTAKLNEWGTYDEYLDPSEGTSDPALGATYEHSKGSRAENDPTSGD